MQNKSVKNAYARGKRAAITEWKRNIFEGNPYNWENKKQEHYTWIRAYQSYRFRINIDHPSINRFK